MLTRHNYFSESLHSAEYRHVQVYLFDMKNIRIRNFVFQVYYKMNYTYTGTLVSYFPSLLNINIFHDLWPYSSK
jgi:hypothetical protein